MFSKRPLRSSLSSASLFRRAFSAAVFAVVTVTVAPSAHADRAPQTSAAKRVTSAPANSRAMQVVLKDKTRLHVVVNEGQASKPTFVLVNGLIWDVEKWDAVASELQRRGHTVIRFAFRLQPESLRLLRRGEEPKALTTGLDATDLAEDMAGVLQALKLNTRIQLVGLSYGAAVAAEFARLYPKTIANTILMAPLVVPLDSYDPSGQYLRAWLANVRFWENFTCDMYGTWNPYLCAYRDFWYNAFYDYMYKNFLETRVQKVPNDIDPAIYKKSVFHLVRAVRDFDLTEYATTLPRVHMMVASRDEKNLLEDQARVWERLPKAARKSLVVMVGANHRLPEEAPLTSADWLDAVASNKPELQVGKTFKIRADR